MKYIKVTHPDGIFVQMYREGKSISKLFPHGTDLKVVREWRDQQVAKFSPYFYRKKAKVLDRNQRLPVGVSVTIYQRKDRDYLSVSVAANYMKKGKHATKSFYVGNLDEMRADYLEHAELTAIAFRQDYEYIVENGLSVSLLNNAYVHWQDEYLFELSVSERLKL